jgi:hypothetical protein
MKTESLKEQMELGLETRNLNRRRAKKPTKRAGWWFSQMRLAVNRAMDWDPRPTSHSHQVYFSLDRQSPNW